MTAPLLPLASSQDLEAGIVLSQRGTLTVSRVTDEDRELDRRRVKISVGDHADIFIERRLVRELIDALEEAIA